MTIREPRYYVEWHPTAQIEAACRERGMKDGDGSSYWYWVRPEDVAKTQLCSDFDRAIQFALFVAPQSCFGGGRIYRQQWVEITDHAREYGRWEDECFWDHVTDGQGRH